MSIPKSIKLTALFLFSLTITQLCSAQSNGNWQPLWLSTTNVFKGIEGFYQLSSCNGSPVVLIKLINHNGFKVKAGWKNLAFNNSGQKISSAAPQDSVIISPNSQLEGSCSGSEKLSAKLSNFGIPASGFKGFFCSAFDFRTIQ